MPNFVWIFVFFLGLTDSRNIKFPATTNHHRHTRQLISERSILPYTLDGFIISECKHHELTAENESKLQSAIENMYSCFNRKTLFVSSQSDFLNNMEECSKTPKELATICLPWKLKYLPDLYFQYAKSMVKLLYQDNSIIQTQLKDLPNALQTPY
ncbi:uncharacterized protein [Diabrotica undecimpunctata]|uniref:uncharacterized protein isoform X2 n=1 Tax=Diabrotica undecimpunctata TaxID=50387 RepID=UPI003B63D266